MQHIRSRAAWRTAAMLLVAGLMPSLAQASLFQGETLDAVANGAAWLVLVVAPVVGIAIFWIVHILPEKIAEKKHHPQTGAIQAMCLLSLVFGGLLWPLAMLWAMTKPVLYKGAYGVDKVKHGADTPAELPPVVPDQPLSPAEIRAMRERLDALEAAAAARPVGKEG
ncbi:MAG TPA: DUF3302 domain-containing protein [Rhizobacter sp.]|nr:DUF3302 domain-containing protein [Rhizobacter sp.]